MLVAGLAFQIASIVVFFGLYYWFMSRVWRDRDFLNPRFAVVYHSARYKAALLGKSHDPLSRSHNLHALDFCKVGVSISHDF